MSFKTIAIIGANGLLGQPLVEALNKAGTFTTTLLLRDPSRVDKSKFPNTSLVSFDINSSSSLEEVLKGQDALIMLTAGNDAWFDNFKRVIDAAIAVGVKRIVLPEFTGNIMAPRGQDLLIFNSKRASREYAVQKAKEGKITWSAVTTGSFIDWALDNGFMEVDVAAKAASIYDSGDHEWACTTLRTIGYATAGIVQHPAETENRNLLIADFHTSTNKLVAELEKQTGSKFTRVQKDSRKVFEAAIEGFKRNPTNLGFIQQIIVSSFVGDDPENIPGSQWKEQAAIDNKVLGLKTISLSEVVANKVKALNK